LLEYRAPIISSNQSMIAATTWSIKAERRAQCSDVVIPGI
jgi:hypothetical protein